MMFHHLHRIFKTADEILTHHPGVKMVKQEELRERVKLVQLWIDDYF